MSINQMSHSQKKWFSLVVAVILVSLVCMLAGRNNKEAEQATAQQKVINEAATVFLKQGDGKIRKWGEQPTGASVKGGDHAKK
ncbi:hypothetical protein [Massilia sp. NR 4-1]|uniref:hypothetical protein n=1 Tax=Massilia sp. NR 4-1 TaxID=1678028 RepID=UPI00067D6A93|nr:hypothetical protein [Massilia sp. NR 4-1]AKU20773.1 hypothetical protein ACZ75_03875 [Massilia sp. NR 4-1]